MKRTETISGEHSSERPPPRRRVLGTLTAPPRSWVASIAGRTTSTGPGHGTAGAQAGGAERASMWRRVGVVDALVAGLIAVALYAIFDGGVPTRDPWHTLLWGEQLADLRLPAYEVPFAPTPHPLLILFGAALSPLGRAAESVLLLTGMAALGAVAVGAFRLGERLYAWPVGLLAAVIVLTRTTFLYYGVRAGVDVMTLALIVWAAVLEARRPRRGAPVLVILLLAGLLRPEAWLFAAAYWLWLLPGRAWRARAGLAALAAAAPVLWALSDLVVTGNPLWSLKGTQSLADELERETGVAALPDKAWQGMETILAQPELLLVAAGGLLVGLALFRRATLLPAAIVGLNAVAFAGLAVFELPLNARYLLPAGLVSTLLVALAALGWTALSDRRRLRVGWMAAGVGVLVLVGFSAQREQPALADLREEIDEAQALGSDLQLLLERREVERALARCGPLVAPSVRLRPQFAYLTGRDEQSVVVAKRGLPRNRGVLVREATRREHTNDPQGAEARARAGYREVVRNRSWVAYSACAQRDGARL